MRTFASGTSLVGAADERPAVLLLFDELVEAVDLGVHDHREVVHGRLRQVAAVALEVRAHAAEPLDHAHFVGALHEALGHPAELRDALDALFEARHGEGRALEDRRGAVLAGEAAVERRRRAAAGPVHAHGADLGLHARHPGPARLSRAHLAVIKAAQEHVNGGVLEQHEALVHVEEGRPVEAHCRRALEARVHGRPLHAAALDHVVLQQAVRGEPFEDAERPVGAAIVDDDEVFDAEEQVVHEEVHQ
mmetsp:Transcript_15915/g.48573  ORF Transcript_15915/g.48573 Transcript_15915/m.48573 type:complete len:248 (+) Transcript_15915:452-1195(+)